MKVAFGMKAHSGWAALVVVGIRDGEFVIIDRRRVELVEEEWAKQPYHAAEEMKGTEARDLVGRGIDAARRIAVREMRAAVKREKERKNDVLACAVLTGNPMPAWSVEEILSVHSACTRPRGSLPRRAGSRHGFLRAEAGRDPGEAADVARGEGAWHHRE
jgi:hypothetical protein